MNALGLISTEEARDGFYPTPEDVALKLIEDLDWRHLDSVLEPSAGKGNLIAALSHSVFREQYEPYRNHYHSVCVDCIEIDPHLRQILSYEFCGQRLDELQSEYGRLRDIEQNYNPDTRSYGKLSEGEKQKKAHLWYEISRLKNTDVHIVHDDFLTFDSRKRYSLILMNPPFSSGDRHLLKAIEIQNQSGGEIRCILNAETLRNPYTQRRQLLVSKLQELKADVTFVADAFKGAERKADVDIAIVKVSIPAPKHASEFFERLREAAQIPDEPLEDVTDLTVADFMERIVAQFNVEVDAGLALIREYRAMQPYILRDFGGNDRYNSPNISLVVGAGDRNSTVSSNEYLRLTRKKYWTALFTNKEFVSQLTSNLQKHYRNTVESMAAYDFTLFNIQQVMVQMNAKMGQGIQDTILALFDKMTVEHCWTHDYDGNKHYFSGWATNKAHKINRKVILPVSGSIAENIINKDTRYRQLDEAESVISDIEKVFEYLDGNMTAHVDLHGVLENAFLTGNNRNIRCKFFSVTLFKKGTMHITFHDQRLVDRFNIYCCGKKGWLPPSYGRTTYSGMSDREKEVVDGFHGDGTQGAGQAAYEKVLAQANYFLSEPTQQVAALMAPRT